jgi:hypothetical protein
MLVRAHNEVIGTRSVMDRQNIFAFLIYARTLVGYLAIYLFYDLVCCDSTCAATVDRWTLGSSQIFINQNVILFNFARIDFKLWTWRYLCMCKVCLCCTV